MGSYRGGKMEGEMTGRKFPFLLCCTQGAPQTPGPRHAGLQGDKASNTEGAREDSTEADKTSWACGGQSTVC